jgi:hypothetical protein
MSGAQSTLTAHKKGAASVPPKDSFKKLREDAADWQRCVCDILNGNIGVLKTVMGELTDSMNMAQGLFCPRFLGGSEALLGKLNH